MPALLVVAAKVTTNLLQSLPTLDRAWSHIALDFVTGFLPSEGKTVISIMMDCFSKATHFIPLVKIPFALETTKLLVQHIFKIHGIPIDIISDCGPQFISGLEHFL